MKLLVSTRSAITLPLAAVAVLLGLATAPILASGTCHVWQDSPTPTAPYDTWDTAAQDIQTAIDYAASNLASYNRVLVTNGVYAVATGLVFSNAVELVSAEGAEATAVTRSGSSGITLLTFTTGASGAVVDGFSFTNSAATAVTMSRGILRNSVIANLGSANTMHGVNLTGGLVENCVVTNWSSRFGSGINISGSISGTPTVRNCLIENVNRSNADNGGAAISMFSNGLIDRCIIRNCTTSVGAKSNQQGGAVRMSNGTLRNSLIIGNEIKGGTGSRGGGVAISGGTMENSTVVGNTAPTLGGGVYQDGGTVRNSIVYDNFSPIDPDLAKTSGTFTYSCTPVLPGGVNDLHNTILAPLFMDSSEGNYRLNIGSPAIDTGMTIAAVTNDLDGVARPIDGDGVAGALHDMGAYEAPSLADRPLSCTFTAFPLRGWGPLEVSLSANVAGAGEDLEQVEYSWEISANGAVVHTSSSDAFALQLQPGLYDVALAIALDGESVSNSVASVIEVGAYTNYVSTSGSNTHPYDTWAKAAGSINDAVAAAFSDGSSGATVLVGEGTYFLTNTVTIIKPITLVSDKGRDLTIVTRTSGNFSLLSLGLAGAVVDGLTFTNAAPSTSSIPAVNMSAGTLRSSAITDNSTLGLLLSGGLVEDCLVARNSARYTAGIDITGVATVRWSRVEGNLGNYTDGSGDGIGIKMTAAGLVENCVIVSNRISTSTSGQGDGAGALLTSGTLRNSLIVGNRAFSSGSGQGRGAGVFVNGAGALVENCTVADNAAGSGAGGLHLASGTVRNSIVYGNTSDGLDANVTKTGGTFTYSCSTPLISGGSDINNTEGDPKFRNVAAYDFSPTGGSSAIDTGLFQDWMTDATDLAGAPRIKGGIVDMGAYELQLSSATVIMLR